VLPIVSFIVHYFGWQAARLGGFVRVVHSSLRGRMTLPQAPFRASFRIADDPPAGPRKHYGVLALFGSAGLILPL
jgi:hypothetical protein